jgi:pimeloyl-ACP methyl ester carboxylesterase
MALNRRSLGRALTLGGGAAICAALFPIPAPASPASAARQDKPAIVIVHGAFSDAAAWGRVISILQRDGYQVTAVENPLQSFADDVATTKRVVDAQTGRVVLVGHSYGGAVITEAAAGNPNAKALVYIAAIAPDTAETVGALLDKYPSDLGKALRPDSAGFLSLDRDKYRQVFAADLPAREAAVAAATQKPIHESAFGASIAQIAWKSIPSWYLIATQDRALNPDLQRFYAKRIGAKVTQVQSSHAVFVSHPREVARIIEQAATAAERKSS